MPWTSLLAIHGHRLEFQLTLKAYLRRECRARPSISALEAFGKSRALWREYRDRVGELSAPHDGWRRSFNPLDLPEVEELADVKREALRRLLDLTDPRGRDSSAEIQISPRKVEEILESVPKPFRGVFGPCLQLQPANPEARRWVLNRLFEGTGRYFSRMTPLLQVEAREAMTATLRAGSGVTLEERRSELLDLSCVHGHNLNARYLQTRYALSLPGEGFSIPPPVGIPLRDLRLEIGDRSPLPLVAERRGPRLLPVHLGGEALTAMPPIVQFLSALGPGELLSPRPPMEPRRCGSHSFLPRMTLGNVIVRRARWVVPA
ncbi:MAG: lantibiotic dehydratase, partial [Acidobacteriota bacterium]